jgi:enoyl reductase-like protein
MNEMTTLDETAIETIRKKAEAFNKMLHAEPDSKIIRTNEFANNSRYVPISWLEMKLDEMFFGCWETKNFQTKVIANEIAGELELRVMHPSYLTWITRVGAAAVMIQYEAEYEMVEGKKKKMKTDITDISKKITNTLTKDYPHLKAECFRNACLSLGKSFGRDLNREFDAQYTPILLTKEKKKEEINLKILKKKVIDALDVYQGEDKEELKKECHTVDMLGTFDDDFAKDILKRMGVKDDNS